MIQIQLRTDLGAVTNVKTAETTQEAYKWIKGMLAIARDLDVPITITTSLGIEELVKPAIKGTKGK